MMNKFKFNTLNHKDKENVIWKNGKLVLQRMAYKDYIVKMYCIEDFFVEVVFSLSENKIKDIYAIEHERDWQGYLDSINLYELFY